MQTSYGLLGSDWRVANGVVTLTVTVPANTTASVTLRNTTAATAREGGMALSAAAGVRSVRAEGKDLVVTIGSGRYVFDTAAQ